MMQRVPSRTKEGNGEDGKDVKLVWGLVWVSKKPQRGGMRII